MEADMTKEKVDLGAVPSWKEVWWMQKNLMKEYMAKEPRLADFNFSMQQLTLAITAEFAELDMAPDPINAAFECVDVYFFALEGAILCRLAKDSLEPNEKYMTGYSKALLNHMNSFSWKHWKKPVPTDPAACHVYFFSAATLAYVKFKKIVHDNGLYPKSDASEAFRALYFTKYKENMRRIKEGY